MKPIETLPHALAVIATDHPLLQSMMASVRTGQGGRSPSPETPVPGGLDCLSVSSEVDWAIQFLCGVVIDGHDEVRAPAGTGPRADWLKEYAGWIAEVLGAADLDEVIAAADRLRAIVEPPEGRRVPVGLCPVDGCAGGALWARLDPGRGRRMPDVVCDSDSTHSWDEFAYRRLAAMLDGSDLPSRMTVAEWLAWAATRGRVPTEKQVRGWTRRLPWAIQWEVTSGTLDTVRTMDHWISVRARRAG